MNSNYSVIDSIYSIVFFVSASFSRRSDCTVHVFWPFIFSLGYDQNFPNEFELDYLSLWPSCNIVWTEKAMKEQLNIDLAEFIGHRWYVILIRELDIPQKLDYIYSGRELEKAENGTDAE